MNTKQLIVITVVTGFAAASGCSKTEPTDSKVLERLTDQEPILTTTASDPLREPAEVRKEPEPTVEEPVVAIENQPQVFEPSLESKGGLVIQRMRTALTIENREPAAAVSTFGYHDERVYAFVEVTNENESDANLTVHFVGPGGQVTGGIELRIPANAPRWRTWAYTKHAKEPGLWRVEIRNEQGSLLGALPFEVESGC